MIAELPLELRTSIINGIDDDKDLRSLALTCRALGDEAQRALYHSPVIVIYPAQHRCRTPFLEYIASSPDRLALMVRKITITVHIAREVTDLYVRGHQHGQNVHDEAQQLADWLEMVGRWLRAALKLMRRITHLRFFFNSNSSSFHPSWLESLLAKCTFTLKVLVWEVNGMDLKIFINKCLSGQQDLRVLKLIDVQPFDDDSETTRLLGDFCPSLRTVSAPWAVLRAMLRHNREITVLERNGSITFWHSTTNIEGEYPHVKHLWWTPSLRLLSASISSFVNLRLLQVSHLREEDYAPITSLNHLEVIIIIVCQDSDPKRTSQRLFERSDSLLTIYYQLINRPADPGLTHSRHTYDRVRSKVRTRLIYGLEELNKWRALAGLECPQTLQPMFL